MNIGGHLLNIPVVTELPTECQKNVSYLELILSGVLWSDVLRKLVEEATNYQIDIFLWTGCGFGYSLFYFGFTFSSALLVIISVEKFCALYFPLRTKTICTVSMARKISLVTGIIFIGFNLQFFFFTKSFEDGYGKYCYYGNISWDAYLTILFSIIISSLYSYIPFTLMILLNSAIMYKFMIVKWRNRQGDTDSTSQALSKSATRGTAMLLAISFTFIILTGPIAIANAAWPDQTIPSPTFDILQTIQFLNHGINGILYCVIGSRFRNELMTLLQCGKKNTQHSMRSCTVREVTVDRSTSVNEPESTASPT